MEKIKKFCIELLFYSDKRESVVKLTIMLISWALSIAVARHMGKTDSMGSAYFLFSLSILMEYVEKCLKKTNVLARFVLSLFILFTVINLILGVVLILIPNLPQKLTNLMFFITVGTVIFWGVNILIAFNIYDNDSASMEICKSDGVSVLDSESKEVELFISKLNNGALGSINGGENNGK